MINSGITVDVVKWGECKSVCGGWEDATCWTFRVKKKKLYEYAHTHTTYIMHGVQFEMCSVRKSSA